MSAPSEMLQVAATPSGGPVATGVRILNGPCNGPVGAVCTPGDRNLHIEQVQTWAQATNAAFVIRATAMDAAGNEVTQMIPFNVADLSYLLNELRIINLGNHQIFEPAQPAGSVHTQSPATGSKKPSILSKSLQVTCSLPKGMDFLLCGGSENILECF